MSTKIIIGLTLVSLAIPVRATIISDTNRVINWDPGVRGGIPYRTSVYSNLTAGASLALINKVLSDAASNQVVVLGAGGYNINGHIIIPSYKTLRGAGASTILTNATIDFGADSDGGLNPSVSTSITGGNTKGSQSITVSSASGITVGKLLTITQTNPSWVSPYADDGAWCEWCDGDLVNQNMAQTVEVTNVSGNTLGFYPPLYWPWTNSPKAYAFTATGKYAGCEDLRVYGVAAGRQVNFRMGGNYSSWMTNCESDFCAYGADHVRIYNSLFCEVRHCYIHDAFDHGPGTSDKDLVIAHRSSACLVTDNIFYRCHVSVMLEWGASGNVVSYNYSTNTYHNDVGWCINDFDINHGAHPSFNLFEGNVGIQMRADSQWGSSSHGTIARNWFAADNFYTPPFNSRTNNSPGQAWEEGGNNMGISIDYLQLWYNVVGNMAGSYRWTNALSGKATIRTNSPNGGSPTLYHYNFDQGATWRNDQPYVTAIHHGNYSLLSNSQQFDPSISDTNIPNSYYLAGKPGWFLACPWPPIRPDAPATLSATNIPAGYRFYYTNDPPAANPDITPPVITNVYVTNVTSQSADIKWDTDEPSNSFILWVSPNQFLLNSLMSGSMVTNHTLTATNSGSTWVYPGTLYNYFVASVDSSGNSSSTLDTPRTFTTAPPPQQGIAEAALGLGLSQ